MLIEIDTRIAPDNEPVMEEEQTTIGALSYDRDIWLTSDIFLFLLRSYWHEIGHILSEGFRFRERDVLAPEEVINPSSTVELSENLIAFLSCSIRSTDTVPVSNKMKAVGEQFILYFTRGRFNPRNKVTVHKTTERQIAYMIKSQGGSPTCRINDTDNKIYTINNREARNTEIAALYTEYACLAILENTLAAAGVMEEEEFIIEVAPSAPYQRAHNIIARAMANGGKWRIPSMLDLTKPIHR